MALNSQNVTAINFFYGPGTDGDLIVTGTSSSSPLVLTHDMYYRNLTIPVGEYVDTNGFRVMVSQLCTLNGTLSCDGVTGSAPAGGAARTTGSLGGSSAGGAGTLSTNSIGSAGAAATNAFGGLGGAGGYSPGGPGSGAGGTATNVAGASAYARNPIWANLGVVPDPSLVSLNGSYLKFVGGTGGGGGGSAGTVTGATGGGGSGGGILMLAARYLVGTGTISARGGNGGQRLPNDGVVGSGGQGGGGGGGIVIVFTSSTIPQTMTITAAGGLGAKTNVNTPSLEDGANGNNGSTFLFKSPDSLTPLPYPQTRYIPSNLPMIFGTGTDGDVTVAANQVVTLTATMFYRNLTLGTNAEIRPAGNRILVSGTLTMNSGSKITDNGSNGGNGTTSAGGTSVSSLRGGRGGNGGYNGTAATVPSAFRPLVNSGLFSGSGGGTGASAGVTGTLTATPTEYFGTNVLARWFVPFYLHLALPVSFTSATLYLPYLGFGGGAGGGPVVAPLVGGGAGGNGGGAVIVLAREIVGTGSFEAKGGNGGSVNPPTGSAGDVGGGGGGSGGLVLVCTAAPVPNTVTVNVSGGTGGTNALNPSANGTNGADGLSCVWNVNS